MNSLLKRFNILPFLFILNIITMLLGLRILTYIVITSMFVYYSLKLYNKDIYLNKLNKILLFMVFIYIVNMFLSTLIKDPYNISQYIKNMIDLIVIILTILLGIQIMIEHGELYIKEGLLKINNIISVINIYGIIEFIVKDNIFYTFEFKRTAEMYRTLTVFNHPIVYGNVLLIAFWINLLLVESKKIKNINMVLILINIYATKSRSIWIALALTFLIYRYIVTNKTLKNNIGMTYEKAIIGILLIIGSIFLINTPFIKSVFNNIINRFYELLTSTGSVSSEQRLGAISHILEQLYHEPIIQMLIGHGYGDSSSIMEKITIVISNFKTTDNQYISILWDFGLLGLIITIGIILKILISNLKNNNSISISMNFILLSCFIPMFFYNLYWWHNISSIYFLMLGAICIKANDEIV